MPTRLKDVAAQAGVSVKTVSNVVHGRTERVSTATALRVRDALEALNYRPNLAARFLRHGRAGVVAMVVPDLLNPYFSSLCTVVIAAAAEHGYTTLVDHTGGEWDQESLALQGLRPHLVDGLIMSPLALGLDDIRSGATDIPIVLLGERLYEAPYDHVAIDNIAAARVATEHLLALGRRRIAVIGGPSKERDEVLRLRLQGYEGALCAAGIPLDERLVVPISPAAIPSFRQEGAAAMRQLLTRQPPPDAVFGFNDLLALGAMKALLREGYRVPDDVAVIGFDNIEDGLFSTPSLTTIAPDIPAIARSAVSLLLQRIHGDGGSPEFVQPAFRLTVRASTSGVEPPDAPGCIPETDSGGLDRRRLATK